MSESGSQIRILFDRKKMRTKLFAAIGIMTMGILFIFMPLKFNTQMLYSGGFFILVSFILAYHSLKRLTTSKPGFIIDSEGIQDCSGAFCIGPILWCDVAKIRVINNFWHKMIVIDVINAQAYINRQKNVFNKLPMSVNHVFFGSPFCINTSELNISLNDLFETIDRNLKSNTGK